METYKNVCGLSGIFNPKSVTQSEAVPIVLIDVWRTRKSHINWILRMLITNTIADWFRVCTDTMHDLLINLKYESVDRVAVPIVYITLYLRKQRPARHIIPVDWCKKIKENKTRPSLQITLITTQSVLLQDGFREPPSSVSVLEFGRIG